MTLPIPVQLHGRPKQLLPGLLPATVDTRLMDVHVLPIFTTIFKKRIFFFFSLLLRENNNSFVFF